MSRPTISKTALLARQTVGAEIRRLRLARGFTLRDLSTLMGISYVTISEIERGIRPLTRATEFAKALGVAASHLMAYPNPCPHCGGTGKRAER